MTDDEARVFKSLPDEKTRAEFIEEFWAVRDPNPETPENEAKTEFDKRARYAALWFGSYNPYKGRDDGQALENVTAWNEDRGRVYLLLGKPDVIIFFDGQNETTSHDGSRSRLRADQWILEEWIYDQLRTFAVFTRTSGGGWVLESYQPGFLELLEWAKLNWMTNELQRDVSGWFRFKASYGSSGLHITVPVSRVNTDDHFQAELGVRVNVYRDNIKVDEISETKVLKETPDNLFKGKDLEFDIAYIPGQKGNYLFDIIIQDRNASMPSKHRAFVKRTF
jgi:GWxTD domain-containing protein